MGSIPEKTTDTWRGSKAPPFFFSGEQTPLVFSQVYHFSHFFATYFFNHQVVHTIGMLFKYVEQIPRFPYGHSSNRLLASKFQT